MSLVIVASLCSCKVGRWGVEEEDGIGIITDENFKTLIGKHALAIVVFYHPDFASSKSFLEMYPRIAARLKDVDRDVPLGKLNVLEDSKTAKTLGISKVPVIRLFNDSIPIDFNLNILDEDLVFNWIVKNTGQPSIELKTSPSLKQAEQARIACHLFMNDAQNYQSTLANFNKLSQENPDISFYYTSDKDVTKNYKIEHKVTFIVWRDFDDFHKMLGHNEEIGYAEMKKFLDMVKNPLVRELTRELAQELWSKRQSVLIVFSDDPKSKGIETFKKLALDFDGLNVVYATSPITSDFGKEMARFFGISEKDQDCARIVKFDASQTLKYKLDQVTESSLKSFTADFKNKKLSPYYKSEAVPETNNGLVRVVVGNSFESEVLNSDKNVLLWAWAAFSDKCRILGPVYEQLAAKFKADPSIVFATMNGVTNEHPNFNLDGFPTIKLFKKGDKEHPVSFTGEPTFENLLRFVSTNLSSNADETKNKAIDEGL